MDKHSAGHVNKSENQANQEGDNRRNGDENVLLGVDDRFFGLFLCMDQFIES